MALIEQLNQRISSALGEEFATYVPRIQSESGVDLGTLEICGMSADDVSKAPLHASLMTGGVAALAVAMHAMVFVPIVGIVAVPFVTKYYMDRKLADAKARARPQLEEALGKALEQFSEGVITAVEAEIQSMRVSSELRFEELMADLRNRIAEEIAVRQARKNGYEAGLTQRFEAMTDLKQILAETERALDPAQ